MKVNIPSLEWLRGWFCGYKAGNCYEAILLPNHLTRLSRINLYKLYLKVRGEKCATPLSVPSR